LGISTMYLMQECFRLGEAYGMSPHNVAEIIEKGMGRNAWTRDVASTISSLDALSQDPDYFAKMLKACLKDWNCAIALGDKVNVQLPFLRGMMSTVEEVDGHALHSEWRKFVDRNASPS
jgi:3-hydroxyisobutyrate dehydrogenase-like beta-hydroxyacid dehydrogenase